MISQELLLQIAKDHSVTSGEMEVLGAIIISGETISDVATRLDLQPEAVRKRLGEVYRKFGITGKGPGKLAKLQQLLMKNPAPKAQDFSLQYSQVGLGSKTRGKRKGQVELGTESDYLGSRSISDLSRGKLIHEVVNRDLLISDLEKYTGFEPNWDSAPDIEPFYDREKELVQLRQWIVADRSRLVVLYGMAGIGKTSLAVKIGQELEKEFDILIWRSLKQTPTLAELIAGIEDFINPGYIASPKITLEENINRLINYLRERRCLIILDDLEAILEAKEIAGHYQSEHSQYGELIKRIASEKDIQSCLVIVSSEKIADLVTLENTKVHSLQVEGSKEIAQQILASQGLEENDNWDKVITNYGGNPLGLKIVITMIKDLYDGQVENFVNGTQGTGYLDFHYVMDQQFARLSSSERELMFTLAALQRPIGIAELHTDSWLNLPQSELIEVMTSLRGRSLLERSQTNFSLQPMIWRHTVEQIIKEIAVEIVNFLKSPDIDNLKTLRAYPWQIDGEEDSRLLLLVHRYFKSRAKALGKELPNLVKTLEENYESQSGYAIDNLKALVSLLELS